MIIRLATKEDVPQIVGLLKRSLGESLLKKSTEIWEFKHDGNPFGASYVLVAEEGEHLLGVRAFMQWRWQHETTLWQAYRAVDTATDPNQQGRGIFKTLTLQALADVQALQPCFIFNTPNTKSTPGYLKMGWKPIEKIRLATIPTSTYFLTAFLRKPKTLAVVTKAQIEALCARENAYLQQQKVLFTPKSVAYLDWRYENNPMQKYTIQATPDWYFACYVKKHRYFKELRVAETLGALTKKNRKEIRRRILQLAFKNGCTIITTADKKLFPIRFYGTFGPLLTCRDLTPTTTILAQSKNKAFWKYSLGDLELF
jgi:N-acetylglutamate synthase-like GNAT family acetyltransferase